MLTLRLDPFRGAAAFTAERVGNVGSSLVLFDPVPPKRADLLIGAEGRDLAGGATRTTITVVGPNGPNVNIAQADKAVAILDRMVLVPPGWRYGAGVESVGVPQPSCIVYVLRLELLD